MLNNRACTKIDSQMAIVITRIVFNFVVNEANTLALAIEEDFFGWLTNV